MDSMSLCFSTNPGRLSSFTLQGGRKSCPVHTSPHGVDDPSPNTNMASCTFTSVPIKYAPKRKFLEFAKPAWHNKLGEFSDPDILSWINNLYQDKAFPTREAFNKAYDAALDSGVMPSERVCWRNKTMVITKDDVANFVEEFDGGAFGPGAEKLVTKMKALVEKGEKVLFVY